MVQATWSMHGKICLVIGATSGLGLVTAQARAQYGATVVIVGRHAERGAAAVARIKQAKGNAAVTLLVADLSVQAEIRRLVQEFQGKPAPRRASSTSPQMPTAAPRCILPTLQGTRS